MAGLREKKKKIDREKILKGARDLFLQNGFESTTTDQIAEKAELSVGTIYNHYRTKEDIFINALLGDYGLDFPEDNLPANSGQQKVLDVVLEYILKFVKPFFNFERGLLKELMKAGFNSQTSGSVLISKLINLDQGFMDNIAEIIHKFEKPETSDLKDITRAKAEIIFSITAYEMLNYIYDEVIKADDVIHMIKVKAGLVL